MPIDLKEIYINLGISLLLLVSALVFFAFTKRDELEKIISGTSRWAGFVKSEKDRFTLVGRYGYRMYLLSLFVAFPMTVFQASSYYFANSNIKASMALTGLTFVIMIVLYKYPIKAFIYFKK